MTLFSLFAILMFGFFVLIKTAGAYLLYIKMLSGSMLLIELCCHALTVCPLSAFSIRTVVCMCILFRRFLVQMGRYIEIIAICQQYRYHRYRIVLPFLIVDFLISRIVFVTKEISVIFQ